MPSYSKQTTLSTYFINKQLIESLEEYFLKDVPRIVGFDPSANGVIHSIEIDLHDSHGMESYKSIKEYKLPMFRDDLEGISIIYKIYSSILDLEIKIRFGEEKENSDLAISLSGENAREKVSAIEHGIISTLGISKTSNWILFPNQVVALIFVIAAIATGIAALSDTLSRKEVFIYGSIFWLILIYRIAFPYLKGYCSFNSLKRKQLDKWFSWLIMGLAGFVLFTTIMTAIRKSILGF